MDFDGVRLCGVPDQLGATGICKWPQKRVLWCVTGRLPGLSDEELVAAYREAWSYWAAVCGIEPVYTEQASQANVLMGSGLIDGGNGTLAWSELPCSANPRRLEQKYDTGERWVISDTPPAGKIDLVRVAAHEIGHVIGLPHFAGGTGNLLDPTYSTRIRKPQAGDTAEARRRYGAPAGAPAPVPTPTPTPAPAPAPTPGGFVNELLEKLLLEAVAALVARFKSYAASTATPWDDMAATIVEEVVNALIAKGGKVTVDEAHALLDQVKAKLA